MLGDSWRGDEPRQRGDPLEHGLSRSIVSPPILSQVGAAGSVPGGLYVFDYVGERGFVQRGGGLGHLMPEVDYPFPLRTPCHVHSIEPRLEDVRIGTPVGIGGEAEPCARQIVRNIETAFLYAAHERYAAIAGELGRFRNVRARGQVGVDARHGPTVQAAGRFGVLGAETDQRNAHRGPSTTQGSSAQASKIAAVSTIRSSTARLSPPWIELVATRPARVSFPSITSFPAL